MESIKMHLKAVSNLLNTMETTRVYQQTLADQKWTVEQMIGHASLDVHAAVELSNTLKEMPWPQDHLDDLLACVNRSCKTTRSGKTRNGNSKLQDYSDLLGYFTAPQWAFLLAESIDEGSKLDGILGHLKDLGLVNATKKTFQMIFVLHLSVAKGCENAFAVSATDKYNRVNHVKTTSGLGS